MWLGCFSPHHFAVEFKCFCKNIEFFLLFCSEMHTNHSLKMKKSNDFSSGNFDVYVRQALERHAERRRLLNACASKTDEQSTVSYIGNEEMGNKRHSEMLNLQAKVQQSLFEI